MRKTAGHWLGQSLVVIATLLAGCADQGPVAPEGLATTVVTDSELRAPDLGACDSLQVPAASVLVSSRYAEGVQIYRWNGTSWGFVAPSALLFPNANAEAVIGTHYAGPTWESESGSKVVGAVLKRCTPEPTAIQWLLLETASSQGPGIFDGVTHIQRLNTTGGLAPSTPGDFVGQEARVPYTTDYFFYRAQ